MRDTSDSRADFLASTYAHFLGAIAAFIAIEIALFRSGRAVVLAERMLSVNWLWVLGAYILVSFVFGYLAHHMSARWLQYVGLAGGVGSLALLFVPLLFQAERIAPRTIETAALVSVLGFCALTVAVFWSRHDFSFLAPFLSFFGLFALGLIVYACLFGVHLGLWFSSGMILLAVASVLYDTSEVLLHFDDGEHVAAALELFTSLGLLFWYAVRWAAEWVSDRD